MASGEGMSLREALIAAGVRGQNLELLAASPKLTAQVVNDERKRVASGRNVRNPTAVLVASLAALGGVQLKRRQGLDPDELRFVAAMEAARRRFKSPSRGP
jgi:hypothetical protein